jgi:hypothetical protein
LGGFARCKLKELRWKSTVSLAKLSDQERQIMFQSMNAILRRGFLDGEFQTRLGIEREELHQIAVAYPNVDDSDDDSNATIAINNYLNEVCYGITFSEREWSQWFGVSRSEVEEVYRKWTVLRGRSRTGVR